MRYWPCPKKVSHNTYCLVPFDRKGQGLTEVLAGVVCEAECSQLAVWKVYWMEIFEETTTEAVYEVGSPELLVLFSLVYAPFAL